MNAPTNQSVASACDYCGRENPHKLRACAECGTPLVSEPPRTESLVEPEPKRKSKVLAIFLSLLLGPVGLLYAGAWWPAFLIIALSAPVYIAHAGGPWLAVAIRIFSAAWAYCTLLEHDEATKPQREAAHLLDEAARLESVDRSKAVAAYAEVIRLYPDTPASREAERNMETLSRQA